MFLTSLTTLHSNCFFCSGHCIPVPQEDGAEVNDNVRGWRGRSAASEEGKGQRHGNRGVGGIDKGAVHCVTLRSYLD